MKNKNNERILEGQQDISDRRLSLPMPLSDVFMTCPFLLWVLISEKLKKNSSVTP